MKDIKKSYELEITEQFIGFGRLKIPASFADKKLLKTIRRLIYCLINNCNRNNYLYLYSILRE